MIDAYSILASTVNELSPEEQAQRPYLFSAAQVLLEMRASLRPADDFQSQMQMTLPAIVEWAERLRRAREDADLVYLFWVSDVLDTQDLDAGA
jgi:hypothetical protein